jgi:hypothetical protein
MQLSFLLLLVALLRCLFLLARLCPYLPLHARIFSLARRFFTSSGVSVFSNAFQAVEDVLSRSPWVSICELRKYRFNYIVGWNETFARRHAPLSSSSSIRYWTCGRGLFHILISVPATWAIWLTFLQQEDAVEPRKRPLKVTVIVRQAARDVVSHIVYLCRGFMYWSRIIVLLFIHIWLSKLGSIEKMTLWLAHTKEVQRWVARGDFSIYYQILYRSYTPSTSSSNGMIDSSEILEYRFTRILILIHVSTWH